MIKVVSLFAGIGGVDLGAEQAGCEVVAQVENDKFCNRVLAKHWPDTLRLGDIRDVRGRDLPPVGVICAGTPCVDLSVAGRRAGLAGTRSGLFFEAARIVDEHRPALFIWENVMGAFSSNAGRDFTTVLSTLADLGARDIAWRSFNSRWAGVPQQRRRVYLVADFGGERAAEILCEPEACKGHPVAGGAAGEDVARPLGASSTGGRRGDLDGDTYIPEVAYALADAQDTFIGEAYAIRTAQTGANGIGGAADAAYTLDGADQAVAFEARYARNGRGAPQDVSPPLKAENGRTGIGDGAPMLCYDETQVTSPGNVSAPRGADVTHPLQAGGRPPAIAFDQHDLRPSDSARSAATESDGSHRATVHDGWRIRFMTPVEQERVQGFPDGHTCLCGAEGDIWSCSCPDGPRNRALGNAVTVPVARWIFERIARVLA
jgi:DNA (cytosine-5)-methyltransferase 1